jgi:hypothetical protein
MKLSMLKLIPSTNSTHGIDDQLFVYMEGSYPSESVSQERKMSFFLLIRYTFRYILLGIKIYL